MLFSVIIPAFKVDKYIEKCIRSLENQDFDKTQYEIIVTNDGSPDQVREIIERLQLEYNNLVLINQENQGVSIARNNAIKIAKGTYILPIDPDDYIVANSLGNIAKTLEKLDVDLLFLPYQKIDSEGKIIWQSDFSKFHQSIQTNLFSFFETKGENNSLSDPDRSWAILFKKKLIDNNKILYPEKVPYLEDAIFFGKVFCLC